MCKLGRLSTTEGHSGFEMYSHCGVQACCKFSARKVDFQRLTLRPHFSAYHLAWPRPLVKVTVLPFLLVLSFLPPPLPSLTPPQNFSFNYMHMYVWVYVWMSVHMSAESRGIASPRAGVVGSCLVWVLETRAGASARAVDILKH